MKFSAATDEKLRYDERRTGASLWIDFLNVSNPLVYIFPVWFFILFFYSCLNTSFTVRENWEKRNVFGEIVTPVLADELNCHEDLRSLELGRTEPEKMNLRTNCGMKMHEALECLRGSRRQRSTQADLRKPRKRSASVAGGTTRAFKIQKCSPLKRRKSGGDDIVAQKATTACSVRVEKLAVPVLDVAPRLPAIVPAPANQARENCNSVESGYDSDENSGTNSSNQGQSPSRGDLESEPVSSAEELNKSGNGDEDDVGLLKKRCDEAVRILGHVLSRMSAKRSALQNSHGLVGDLPSWIASRLASANFALNPSTSEPLSARLCSSAESVTPTTLPPKPSSTSVTSATKTSSSESKPFWTEEDLAASVQLEIVLGPSRECDLEELLVVPGLPTAMPRKRSKRLSPPAMTDACDGNKMADDDSSSCSSVSSSSQPASPMSSCQVLSVFFEVRSADADGDSSFCFQTGSL
ncbi:unnamed protein product [Notodromas monacha]|uniref:Uncharacterized protein n=1 Tax=Notodromas monacha TaxID=399045 RepID=A0A7R9BJA8_9CRUS|nr:unnamed protein product [Notodromas monacha]CAG0915185.1 unnamed protein product [Notodromas monacha]